MFAELAVVVTCILAVLTWVNCSSLCDSERKNAQISDSSVIKDLETNSIAKFKPKVKTRNGVTTIPKPVDERHESVQKKVKPSKKKRRVNATENACSNNKNEAGPWFVVLSKKKYVLKEDKPFVDRQENVEISGTDPDDQILLEKLPYLVWQLVFGHLTTHFQLLESCSEVSDLFDSLVRKQNYFCIRSNKIVPRVFRKRQNMRTVTDINVDLVLLHALELNPRISTFEIFMGINSRLSSKSLNSFLKAQCESLHTFHISCPKISEIVLDLSELRKLRNLKIFRTHSFFTWTTLAVAQPIYNILPSLECLALSLGAEEGWEDFLPTTVAPDGTFPAETVQTVRHLRLFETEIQKFESVPNQICKIFTNLVSLEIPVGNCNWILFSFTLQNLQRLTLELPLPLMGLHKHLFDATITGYGKEVCAAILENPQADPVRIREIVEGARSRDTTLPAHEIDEAITDNVFRILGLRRPNLTKLQKLELLRIKCGSGEFGPTIMSCPDLLAIRSLKVLDFCGRMPIHISEDWMQKLRNQFTVHCG